MAAPYYVHTNGLPGDQQRGIAGIIRDELDKIAASFGLLPLPAAMQGGTSNYAVDTGAANAYAVTVGSAIIAYTDGLTILFKATNANTGDSTLNVNNLGAVQILRQDGAVLQANDFFAGQISPISYSSTSGKWQMNIPALPAANQATAAAATATTQAGIATTQAGIATTQAGIATTGATTATTQAGIATTQAGLATTNGATQVALAAAQVALATTQAGNAAQSAADAASYSAALQGTSTTSLLIAQGAKVFTTQTNRAWSAGQFLTAASAANNGNYMHGQITSYSGTTLTLNVLDVGGSSTFADWILTIAGARGPTGPQGLPAAQTYIARTSNTQLVASNAGNFIDVTSGTFTQTFDTNANLGPGWALRYRNSGTGQVTIPSSDGATNWVIYPGEVRDLNSDGTTLRSVVVQPFALSAQTSGNFIKPPGYSAFDVRATPAGSGGSSGGGGGSGRTSTTSGNGVGGLGGGGGAGGSPGVPARKTILAAALANSTAFVIGAPGTGGPSAAGGAGVATGNFGNAGTPSNAGQAGGNTTFGTLGARDYVSAIGGTPTFVNTGSGGLGGTPSGAASTGVTNTTSIPVATTTFDGTYSPIGGSNGANGSAGTAQGGAGTLPGTAAGAGGSSSPSPLDNGTIAGGAGGPAQTASFPAAGVDGTDASATTTRGAGGAGGGGGGGSPGTGPATGSSGNGGKGGKGADGGAGQIDILGVV